MAKFRIEQGKLVEEKSYEVEIKENWCSDVDDRVGVSIIKAGKLLFVSRWHESRFLSAASKARNNSNRTYQCLNHASSMSDARIMFAALVENTSWMLSESAA